MNGEFEPATLMALETLQCVQKSIQLSLRHLKELEAPELRQGYAPAGGPHREQAMSHLRQALHDVSEAMLFHYAARPAAADPLASLLEAGEGSRVRS